MATTIEYNIKVNDGGATQTLGQLENELEGINKQLKDVEIGSDAFKDLSTKSQALTKDLESAQRAIGGLTQEDKIRGFQGSIDILGGSVAGLTGAVGLLGIESEEFEKYTAYAANAIAFSEGIRTAAQGVVDLGGTLQKSAKAQRLFAAASTFASTAMGKFKIALAATGIGAIVLALVLLIQNFDKVKEVVGKAANAFPALGAVISVVKDGFNAFIDAVRPALEWLGLLPDEIERAEIKAKEFNKVVATEAEKNLARAKAAGASAQTLHDLKIKLIDAELQALRDADAEIADIEAKAFEREIAIITERKRLADEAELLRIEARTKRNEELVETATQNAEFVANATVGIQTLTNTEDLLAASTMKVNIAQGASVLKTNASNKADADKIKKQKGVRDGLGATADALGNLGAALDQESAAAKALAISSAIINTYLGVTEILKQKSTLPSPFDFIVKIANVAGTLAAGFGAVKAITATPVKSSGGGGSPRGGIAAPSSAPTSFTAPTGISPEDAVASQGPIQAYVVSGDITSSQEAEAKIQSSRTID